MTEYDSLDVQNMKHMCRACLKVTDEALPMTADEIKTYKNFVNKMTISESDMILCLICKWILRKCMKFIVQVRQASDILHNISSMDTKSYLYLQLRNFDISATETMVHYIEPGEEVDMNDKEDYMAGDDDDDDELPLVMLQDYKSKKKKVGEPKPELEIKLEEDIKEEVDKEENSSKRCRKEIKEGFTSRMVQETDEYVVIKLSTEQVLQELSEKAKSESYLRAPYKCVHCVKGFNFEDVLCTHMEKHRRDNGSYECDICRQFCPTPVSLRGHMKSHTTRYKCKVCGQVRLSRQHLLEHYTITHTSAPTTYSCDKCDFTSNKRTVIQRHVKSHVAGEKHACHSCGKLFNSIESLRVHTMRHDKTKLVQCSQCDKSFIYPSLLHKHVRAVHDRKEYYCVECDVSFKSPESLRLHFKKAKRHRDPSSYRYECHHCQQRFVSTATLSVHLTSSHGEPKQHACQVCNNHYSSKEALRAHIWRVHSHRREAPVNCHYCEKSFTRKSILAVHVRSHTGACGAFTQRATLRTHQPTKHAQKQENQPPAIEVQAS